MTQATHRQPLDKALRRALEATVVKARDIAELAASQALTRLSVGEPKAADYLNDQQRQLRTRLRAHGRQLGDSKQANGQQSLNKLITEVAYEHWHRMLFARFLEQNHLLMYDEHTPLTLAECSELVQDPDTLRDALERRCNSGWELAGVLASKMLPQIFRIDSPVFALEFAPEHQRELEKLVTGLAADTFQAQDSLGWVYQFWQSKRKEEVNKSEVKIGADELSPVTQLFTEPYMVSFLLDNSLGAWWAGQRLTEHDWETAENEQQLREMAAIPSVPLSYLRFVKDEATQQWQPASGTFDAWPKRLSELKVLDPCCGSGHFLVAAFLMLVPMRMERNGLSAREAVDAVLRENIHGLELDQRCVELAAFALALIAWKYPNTGGYRALPELNVACSGLSVSVAKEEWKQLGLGKKNLTIALDWMYDTFKDAPVLGSLLNPAKTDSAKLVHWDELSSALEQALKQEQSEEQWEVAVVAQGLARASSLLAGQFDLVLTNVPYLAVGKQSSTLLRYVEKNHEYSRHDLATVFLERCIEFCGKSGTACLVTPQNWLFLSRYKQLRENVLQNCTFNLVSTLGYDAFQTPLNAAPILILLSPMHRDAFSGSAWGGCIRGVDVSSAPECASKASRLSRELVLSTDVRSILSESTMRINFEKRDPNSINLGEIGSALKGSSVGDLPLFVRKYWEICSLGAEWEFHQVTSGLTTHFSGKEEIILWEKEQGRMFRLAQSVKHLNHAAQNWLRGKPNWRKKGVVISLMHHAPVSIYSGDIYAATCTTLVPFDQADSRLLGALWAFCSSDAFMEGLKKLTKKSSYEVKTILDVPIDLAYWTKVAEDKFPTGLPKPYTNDPTQWVFHGHPCGSVIWDEGSKWTAHGDLRVDDSVLQVAIARLLGYRWPAELDPEMELAAEQRKWVERCAELASFVDDDGIVCLPPVRGEKSADQRLEALLQAAYGDAWTTPLKNRLLDAVGSKSLSLWLRDKFFEQHCKLFQHRPFIWHIWDGLKDGFSVLVNYHKLDKAGLERLIYTYLGDWIRTQQAGLANGEDGAQERLAAAETLKKQLEAILEGEKPYDIFVRWKPLAEQPIGWNPDLNDGVRLNIRPFLYARDVSKKGAGILRWAPNIKWTKDRGKDVESAPWYTLGLQYDEGEGARINDHHLSLAEKRAARSH